jgi:hypothetical protein
LLEVVEVVDSSPGPVTAGGNAGSGGGGARISMQLGGQEQEQLTLVVVVEVVRNAQYCRWSRWPRK